MSRVGRRGCAAVLALWCGLAAVGCSQPAGGQPLPSADQPSLAEPVPASTPPSTRPPFSERFGIAAGDRWLWAPESDLPRYADYADRAKATRIRLDVRFAIIAENGRSPSTWDWSQLDAMVKHARQHNLQILGTLGTAPSWNRPSGSNETYGPDNDARRTAFAEFAATAAERYRGQIDQWEVWNEPNLHPFWTNPSVESYAALLRVTAPRIRQANPNAVIVAGGTGESKIQIPTDDWYAALYRVPGVKDYFDVVAVHPYVNLDEHGVPNINSGEMLKSRRVEAIVRAEDKGTPIWGTEFGVTTGGDQSVSEEVQAQTIDKIISAWNSVSEGPVFYHTLFDGSNPKSREDHFGIWRLDGTPKPALAVLERWARDERPR